MEAIAVVLTWVIFGAYLAFLAVAGLYARKKTKTLRDFMVAGRSIGPLLLGVSFGVTYFSAVMVVGGGAYSWSFGISTLWIAGLNTLAGVVGFYIFFGKRTRALGEHLDSMTVPQLLGERYKEKKLQSLTAIVILVFQTIYVMSIYQGLATLLHVVIPGFTETAFIISTVLVGIITVIYLNVGGSHGAIFTDALESVVILVGILVIFGVGLYFVGGFQGLISGLQDIENTTPDLNTGDLTAFPGVFGLGMIGMVSVTSFGVWGMPQMITRFYTAKESKTLRWGLVISACWAFAVAFFAWFNGAIARVFFYGEPLYTTINDVGGETAIPWLMVETLPIVAGLIMAAVTAASLTSGEKIILMAASSFSIDFYQEKTKASDDKTLKVTRIVSTIVVVIGVVGSIIVLLGNLVAILDLCMFAWAAMCSVILVPYIMGLFWKKGTGKAAFWSGLIGLIFAVIQFFCFYAKGRSLWFGLYPEILGEIASIPLATIDILGFTEFTVSLAYLHPFLVGPPISLVLFIIISYFDKDGAPPKEYLKELFTAMKEEETIIEQAK